MDDSGGLAVPCKRQSSSDTDVPDTDGTLRSECLNIHWFLDLKEARHLIEAWRQEYNESRPHASLDDRTPSEFASQIAASRDLAGT
ncbi:integrase core domain-containing protein [Tunturiibacter gelidiferens]|uniref:integrase core domain-containing protein n=1 Tax=Tunturiibacter gelidiferens TaxID=3069689 RepID=UPI003D9AEA42